MKMTEDILQSCLEDMEGGLSIEQALRRSGRDSQEMLNALLVADRYRQAPAIGPSETFRATARARMLRMILADESVHHVSTDGFFKRWWGNRARTPLLRLAAAVAVCVVVISGGVAAVSAEAPPDSPVYPVRLVLEQTRLTLALNEEERIELQLRYADTRIDELTEAVRQGQSLNLCERIVARYEEELQAVVRRASSADGPKEAAIEARLELQAGQLRAAMSGLGDGESEIRAVLGQALGFIERERYEFRIRLGQDPSENGGLPSSSLTPEVEQRSSSQFGNPSTTMVPDRGASTNGPAQDGAMSGGNGQGTQVATPEPERNRQGAQYETPAATTSGGVAVTPTTEGGAGSGAPGATKSSSPNESGGASGYQGAGTGQNRR